MHFGTAQCKQRGPALSECNESKGFAHIFALVGVLVVILVVGEVYFFSKVKPAEFIQTLQNVPVVSDQSSDKPVSKSKDFLQIPKTVTPEQPQFNDYTDKNLGLGFQFAKDLIAKIDSEDEYNKRGNGDFRKNFKGYVGYEPGKFLGAVAVLGKDQNFDTNPFSVWIFDNPDNLTIEAWFDKYWYYPFLWGVFDRTSKGHVTPDQEATVSGKIGKYKIVSYQPDSPKYVYFSNGGKSYLLRVIGETGEQILSGFKFISD